MDISTTTHPTIKTTADYREAVFFAKRGDVEMQCSVHLYDLIQSGEVLRDARTRGGPKVPARLDTSHTLLSSTSSSAGW